MYQFLQSLTSQALFLRQIPALSAALVVASLVFRFGNFALGCVAFLATWFVVDAVIDRIARGRVGNWFRRASEGRVT